MDVEKNLQLLTEITFNMSKMAVDNEKSSLLIVNPPTSKGKEKGDIFEFLEQFEEQTATLSDNQKISFLSKAFKGQSKIWYKTSMVSSLGNLSWPKEKTGRQVLTEGFT